jgi:hypothetical protein
MNEAKLAIQSPCPHSPGKRGTFIYRPTSQGNQRISPLCDSLITLFDWTDKNGWDLNPERNTFTKRTPDNDAQGPEV